MEGRPVETQGARSHEENVCPRSWSSGSEPAKKLRPED
jgi:hypothetical protein